MCPCLESWQQRWTGLVGVRTAEEGSGYFNSLVETCEVALEVVVGTEVSEERRVPTDIA